MTTQTKHKNHTRNNFRSAQAQKPKQKTDKLGLFNRCLFGCLLICGVYFVISINDLSVKSFILQDLQAKAENLRDRNQSVELEVMQLQSYENISQRARDNQMVRIEEVDYITVHSGVVAKK